MTIAEKDGKDITDATVNVNGTKYEKAVETTPNQILTLEAKDGTKDKFSHWSNGSREKTITITATGMSMGLTAFFTASA